MLVECCSGTSAVQFAERRPTPSPDLGQSSAKFGRNWPTVGLPSQTWAEVGPELVETGPSSVKLEPKQVQPSPNVLGDGHALIEIGLHFANIGLRRDQVAPEIGAHACRAQARFGRPRGVGFSVMRGFPSEALRLPMSAGPPSGVCFFWR